MSTRICGIALAGRLSVNLADHRVQRLAELRRLALVGLAQLLGAALKRLELLAERGALGGQPALEVIDEGPVLLEDRVERPQLRALRAHQRLRVRAQRGVPPVGDVHHEGPDFVELRLDLLLVVARLALEPLELAVERPHPVADPRHGLAALPRDRFQALPELVQRVGALGLLWRALALGDVAGGGLSKLCIKFRKSELKGDRFLLLRLDLQELRVEFPQATL
mmetsp:Transcript_62064/g.175002  ORF Transcript_62064/g.175002 Transcript_62064/m.175002 type:complete len:223 (-) Transcript_62064:228-896(-)